MTFALEGLENLSEPISDMIAFLVGTECGKIGTVLTECQAKSRGQTRFVTWINRWLNEGKVELTVEEMLETNDPNNNEDKKEETEIAALLFDSGFDENNVFGDHEIELESNKVQNDHDI